MCTEYIKSLADRGDYRQALQACNQAVADGRITELEQYTLRAYIHASAGNYRAAVREHETRFLNCKPDLGELFVAANHAMHAEAYEQAGRWLSKVLALGKEQTDNWFESAAHFYLAFIHFKFGNSALARQSLSAAVALEPDAKLPLPGIPMCSANQLLRLIQDAQ